MANALLPLEQVNPSVGPFAYLDLFERAAMETVSRACREEVRTPVLWRQVTISRGNELLVNEVLKWLFGNERYSCALLTSLNVTCCSKLTDESIKAVAAGCASLTSLNVSYCHNLTDESIKAVAAGCTSLASLDVRDCSNLTNGSIKAVAAGCASLTSLDVNWCSKITDESIKAVAAGCASLKKLSVHGCSNLTDGSIKALAAGCPLLVDVSAPERLSLLYKAARQQG